MPALRPSSAHRWIAGLVVFSLSAALAAQRTPEEAKGKRQESPLVLESITVEPDAPGPGRLCRLRVRLVNRGPHAAYGFAFDVRLNGKSLPAYDRQLFFQVVDPGVTAEIRLFNFWTPDQEPEDGKLTVEVVLRQGTWVVVQAQGDTETWTPLGAVEGLPVALRTTLDLTTSPDPS